MRRLNTIHISVLETRAFPASAAYLTAHCGGQKVRLGTLSRGKLLAESGGSLVGVETAETIWINAYDTGLTFDSVLGSCMLLLSMFDLQQRPYEGWLPLTTLEGALVGRVAVQIFGDFSERLCVTVTKALIAEKADMLSEGDFYVEVRLRGERQRTKTQRNTRTPVWDEPFRFFIGSRDKLYLALHDSDDNAENKFGTAEVLGVDLLQRSGDAMWIPIANKIGEEMCKVLIQVQPAQFVQLITVRVLAAKGMAPADADGTSDLYVVGKCGAQTFRTTTKANAVDAVWDEEFPLEVRPFDALHLLLQDQDLIWDDALGEAFIPAAEMVAHAGEQVWVDLTGTGGKHNGKLLLWISPPPGSVYPDTLSAQRLRAAGANKWANWQTAMVAVPKSPGEKPLGGSPPRPSRPPSAAVPPDRPSGTPSPPQDSSRAPPAAALIPQTASTMSAAAAERYNRYRGPHGLPLSYVDPGHDYCPPAPRLLPGPYQVPPAGYPYQRY